MIMKKFIVLLIGIAAYLQVVAQQEYSYTFFGDNRNFVNPAAAGTNPFGSVTGMFRKQWVGVEGTPVSGGVTFDMPFKKQNMGIGALVYQDHIGVTNQTNIAAMYAYHLKLSRGHYLSFGLSGGMDVVNTDYTNLTYWDAGDQTLENDYVNVIVPHIGFGIQYFWEDLYVGVSLPRMLSVNADQFNSINFSNAPALLTHYYFNAGYHFKFRNDMSFKPGLLLKYVGNSPLRVDVALPFWYKEMLGFGVTYKSLGFLSTFLQYNLKDILVFGYAFDFSMNPLQGYSKGTHEAMIQYRFGKRGLTGSSRL